MLLYTLDEGVAKAVDKFRVGGLVEHTLQVDLDGTHHVGRLVEKVEVFLHHGFIIACALVECGQLADVDEVVLHLAAGSEIDTDGIFGVSGGLESLRQLGNLLGIIAYHLHNSVVGLCRLTLFSAHLIRTAEVDMKIQVLGIHLDALLHQTFGTFETAQLQIGTEEHLIIEFVGSAVIEGFVAFCSLFKLPAGIVVCGQLFLRLL